MSLIEIIATFISALAVGLIVLFIGRSLDRRRSEKQRKLVELNAPWKRSRKALRRVEEPLKQLDKMNKDSDKYPGPKCIKLSKKIGDATQQIDGSLPEFAGIKEKLLEYMGQSPIYGTISFEDFAYSFQKKHGDISEPLELWREAQEVLNRTAKLPYSEKDV